MKKTMKADPQNLTKPTSAELIAALKRTNNGYLFAPTGYQLETAREHPELFITRPNAFGRTGIYPR